MTDWRKTSGHPTPPATLLPSAIRPLPSVICHLSFAIRHSGLTLAPFPSRRPRDVRLGIELLACALVAHEPHGAEDRPLGPWAVVLAANRPGNSGVAVGVAAVHLVAIVQKTRVSSKYCLNKISFRQDLSSKAIVKQAKTALLLGAPRVAAQLVDRKVFQEWSEPLDHVGEGFESGCGIAELAAGSHRLEQGSGLSGLRRES